MAKRIRSCIAAFALCGLCAAAQSTAPPAESTPSLAAADVTLVFPDWIMSDIAVDIVVEINPDTLDATDGTPVELACTVDGQAQTLLLEDGKGTLTAAFEARGPAVITVGSLVFQHEVRPIPLWFSILPPLLAIVLALIFREVLFSLFIGIFVGAAIIGVYQSGWHGLWSAFFSVMDTYVIEALNDWGHLAIILFSMMIGAIVAIVSRNGGMLGVVHGIAKRARTARTGQLATWVLGVAIFFDDYANSLVVGNTMRPITDRLRISREKLSYLVDSTAAPVSAIAFVTTWIGVELGYIGDGIRQIEGLDEGVYAVFVRSLQYSFYPVFTLAFIIMLIVLNRDFGPMFKAESRARTTGAVTAPSQSTTQSAQSHGAEHLDAVPGIVPRWINAVIPVGIVVFGTVVGLLVTGMQQAAEALQASAAMVEPASLSQVWGHLHLLPNEPVTFLEKLGTVVGFSDSYYALLWASLAGLAVAIALTRVQGIMSLPDTMNTALQGCKTMFPAIAILILAWSLALVTQHLHTADFMTQLLSQHVSPWAIPPLTFLLAAMISFATGSSWGTMAILYPLMLPASWHISMSTGLDHAQSLMIFENVVSCVLAGSVLGDHCSPISDTTILSSLASSCHHIDHVRTQLPYALTVGTVAVFLGTLPAALGMSSWLTMPIGLLVLFFIIWRLGKKLPEPNSA